MSQTVFIRLVSAHYSNRLEWEDGPGSLQNVVSEKTETHEMLDDMTLAEANELTQGDLEYDYGIYFEEDSEDGFEEFSYKLEYFDPETKKWRLVKFISA